MDCYTLRRPESARPEFPGEQSAHEVRAAWKPHGALDVTPATSDHREARHDADGAVAVDERHIVAVRAGRGGLRVECLAGHVWITAEGAGDDVILATGQTFRTDRAGKVVVQASAPAVIRVLRR